MISVIALDTGKSSNKTGNIFLLAEDSDDN